MGEFMENLDEKTKHRLIFEKDDFSYSLKNILEIHNQTGVPALEQILNAEQPIFFNFRPFLIISSSTYFQSSLSLKGRIS